MARLAVFACIAIVISGCAPDALEDFDSDAGGNNDNNTTNNNNTVAGSNNMTSGTGQPSEQFLAIANIMTVQCGAPSCHGSAATNQFLIATGTQATPDEVFAAMTSSNTTVDGQQLIVASDSLSSNIYTRMVHQDVAKLMPPGASSPQTDIDAVKAWIDAGASFE